MPVLISGASWQAHCPRPSPRRGLPPQTLAWGFLLRGLEGQGDQAFGSRQSLPSPLILPSPMNVFPGPTVCPEL